MNKSFHNSIQQRGWLGLVVLLWLLASMFVVQRLIRGVLFDYLFVAALAFPFALLIYSKLNKYWLSLILGGVLLGLRVPLPIGEALGSGRFMFPALSLGILLFEHTITRNVWKKENWMMNCMVGAAMIATVRLVLDPPGSGRMGADQGGLQGTLMTVVGLWSFVLGIPVLNRMGSLKKNYLLTFVFSTYALIAFAFKSHYIGVFFHRQMWLVAACVLAWSITGWALKNEQGFPKKYMVFSILFMIFGVLAGHRSRPVFALAMIFAGAFAYRQLRRIGILFTVILLSGVFLVVSLKPELLPSSARRALSTVVQVEFAAEAGMSSESGWESSFRAEMYKAGWEKMKKHLFFGNGFGFNTSDVVRGLTVVNQRHMERVKRVGGFHNSLFSLGVEVGIFAPLLYIAGMLGIIFRFAFWCRSLPAGEWKMFAAMLLIYTPPICGQMLMNGGPIDLTVVTFVLGLEYALLRNGSKLGIPKAEMVQENDEGSLL